VSERIRAALERLLDEGRVSSQAEAARLLGVTRQAVNKAVLAYGLDLGQEKTPRPHKATCRSCGRRFAPTLRSADGVCDLCRSGAPTGARTVVCPRCGFSRRLSASSVRQRKTALCKACQSRMPRRLYELEEGRQGVNQS
jgi:hypothetical protein